MRIIIVNNHGGLLKVLNIGIDKFGIGKVFLPDIYTIKSVRKILIIIYVENPISFLMS